jgi:hypothetical protein
MLRRAEPENVMGCDLPRGPGGRDGRRRMHFPAEMGMSGVAALDILSFARVGTERLGNVPVWQSTVPSLCFRAGYNRAMNGITIYVDWTYFLGMVGTLIGIAYYANGRFTKIETTVEWLKEILLEIKVKLDDRGRGQCDHDSFTHR